MNSNVIITLLIVINIFSDFDTMSLLVSLDWVDYQQLKITKLHLIIAQRLMTLIVHHTLKKIRPPTSMEIVQILEPDDLLIMAIDKIFTKQKEIIFFEKDIIIDRRNIFEWALLAVKDFNNKFNNLLYL